MRVDRDPAAILSSQCYGRSARPWKERSVGRNPERVPRRDRYQVLRVSDAVQLIETEGKLPNVRPDVTPLVALERLAAAHDARVGAERDDVHVEERSCPRVVDRANALL